LITEEAEYLLVPSEKNGEGEPGACTAPLSNVGQPCVKHSDCDDIPGDGICGDLQHFLCYDVSSSSGFSGPIPVDLDDQFNNYSLNVLFPSHFCNPVKKEVPDCCNGDLNNDGVVTSPDLLIFNGGCGGNPDICDINCDGEVDLVDLQILQCQFTIGTPDPICCPGAIPPGTYPIVDTQTHLTCYYIDAQEAVLQQTTNDQFDQSNVSFLQTELLCVPSDKLGFSNTPMTPTMKPWGYALLAGLLLVVLTRRPARLGAARDSLG
jgi:hypothetical protein